MESDRDVATSAVPPWVDPASTVAFNDLRRAASSAKDELVAALTRVIDSGSFLMGHETDSFEAEFAAVCRTQHCVAVGNGTDALEIALRSLGCRRGDDVIVTANAGMYATTACLAIGARPVFADIDADTLLLSIDAVAALVTPRTRAVVATHLYGNVVDVVTLRARVPDSVRIVEDAAQAHLATLWGRPVGSLGDAAAFSFYPTKNLGALGDAGALVTSDAEIDRAARALRQYGWERRNVSTMIGGRNSRMDELQAAFLRLRLPRVPAGNDRRRAIRSRYVAGLGDRLRFVDIGRPGVEPVVHLCVARSDRRDRLIDELRDMGVICGVHYPIADHQQPALQGIDIRHGGLSATEVACREVISLPCYPELRDDEVDRVIDAVTRCR